MKADSLPHLTIKVNMIAVVTHGSVKVAPLRAMSELPNVRSEGVVGRVWGWGALMAPPLMSFLPG